MSVYVRIRQRNLQPSHKALIDNASCQAPVQEVEFVARHRSPVPKQVTKQCRPVLIRSFRKTS